MLSTLVLVTVLNVWQHLVLAPLLHRVAPQTDWRPRASYAVVDREE
jgi:hypothetical protein